MTSRADQHERLVFLDRGTIASQIVVRRPSFAHTWIEYNRTTPEQLPERLADRPTIVITNKVPVRESVLAEVPSLELIAVAATGTDVVDIDYCREQASLYPTSAAMRSTRSRNIRSP